jgi:phosphotransferase system  glucose/maltose/N-acetylglucosamine-specific IIC component
MIEKKDLIKFFSTSSLITISQGDIDSMIGWAWQIIDDLKILWLTIIGILLGITVLVIVLRAIRGKDA